MQRNRWLWAIPAVLLPAAFYLTRHPNQTPPDPHDSPDEAAAYYRLMTAPDGEDIPVERYLTALNHIRRMRVYSSAHRRFLEPSKDRARALSLGSWEELGPGNIGGRTRSLLIHPVNHNIMYAGGVAGGVWKSLDAGDSWTALNDLLPHLAVGSMAMDPRNPDTLYIGTGESFAGDGLRGIGIFKTTDGGTSFQLLESTRNSNFYGTNKLVISPNDSNRVYAATQTGIFRSTDGGANWQRVWVATGSLCQDLAIRTDQPNDYMYAACRANLPSSNGTVTNGLILRNTDAAGDGTWEQVYSDPLMRRTSLAIAPSSQSIIYAMAASAEGGSFSGGLLAVYRSASNGDSGSWEPTVTNKDPSRLNSGLLTNRQGYLADLCSPNGTRTFSNQGNYDNVLAVDPVDPNIVWTGGIDLFRSDDGGRNWGVASFWNVARTSSAFAHADHHVLVFHPNYNGGSNQTLFNASDGGLARTENARAKVASAPDINGCSSVNSQVAWRSLNNQYSVTQFYHGTVFPGGHFYFGGTQDNGTPFGADADGLNSWRTLIGGDGGYAAVAHDDATRLYGETQRGTTLTWFRRSTNGGKSFAAAMSGITEPAASTNFLFITPHTMDPRNSLRLYLGGKTVWRTNDGATRWEPASPEFAGGIISYIALAPSNPNYALVSTSAGFIHRQEDATTSNVTSDWPRVQPRAAAAAKIAFDPTNHAIAYAVYSSFNGTTSLGHVFKTTDGGVSWRRIDGSGDSAIPDVPTRAVAVSPIDPNTVYVGSDLGIFVSLDGGQTWAREDTQFPTTGVEHLFIDSTNSAPVLYAFTHGRGAWRVRLTDTPPCTYQVTVPQVATAGGNFQVNVETAPNCSWSVLTQSAQLTLAPPARGTGTGEATVSMARNLSGAPRTALLYVAGQAIQVKQD
ncbi:MAG: hypothetical protein HY820_26175 [Acidobacteria bacterium]|nr:hypothetical protein [Acidobacteriota bacterium]